MWHSHIVGNQQALWLAPIVSDSETLGQISSLNNTNKILRIWLAPLSFLTWLYNHLTHLPATLNSFQDINDQRV